MADTTIADLLKSPSDYEEHTVRVSGHVAQLRVVPDGFAYGSGDVFVITLSDAGSQLPILYRGYVGDLAVGDAVRVEGLFVAVGPGVHADVVLKVSASGRPATLAPPLELLISLGVVGLLGLAAFVFLLTRRVRSLGIVFLLPLFLVGCTLNIQAIVQRDGSASLSLHVTEATENTDFLREIPGLARYLDTWLAQLRQQNVLIERWYAGNEEHLFLQRYFESLEALSSDPQRMPNLDSWVYAARYTVDEEEPRFRYTALVDSTSLYESPPDTPSEATDELHDWLDNARFTYSLVLPGDMVYSNAMYVESDRLLWELPMGERYELVAESRLGSAAPEMTVELDWSWGWWAVGGVALLALGFFALALMTPPASRARPRRNVPGVRRRR